MEQPLDHKIKNAYQTKDKNTSFARKDELWGRISKAKTKGVIAFWRVAAIFFALLLFGGAFASTSILYKQKIKRQVLENRNRSLELVVDSLLNIQPEIVTEIKIVETKKIIYKTVEVEKPEKYLVETKDSVQLLEIENLRMDVLQLKKQLKLTNDSLLFVRNISEKGSNESHELSKYSNNSFKLKPEKVQDQIKSNLVKPNPGLKLQLFNRQYNNIKFDTNSTLLRK